MKRILHALAALWPSKRGDRRAKTEERSRETEEDRSWKTEDRWKTEEDRSWKTVERGLSHEGLWLPEARNGLLGHLNAVMRMGETVRELATSECAHLPIRESAKRQPSESANLQISSTNQQIDESTPKKTDNHLPKRVILSEREQPAERIGEPLPIAQVLARLYLRNAPRCTMGDTGTKDGFVKQPGSASSNSAKPKSQSLSLAPQRAVPLASWVLALFMCLLSAQQVSAQAEPAAAAVIQPLQIGDAIPEELWHLPLQVVNHPEGKETITLNDYRGKLIILDFWGTFCGSCIAAMPKIAEVQRQFAEEMFVLPLSSSSRQATEISLINHKNLKPLKLFSVIDAIFLKEYFPHGVVPHYVWISPRGHVVATTGTNDVSKANVDKVLAGEKPHYAFKTFIDPHRPLLLITENIPSGATLQQYAVFIRGPMVSLGGMVRFRKSEGTTHGMAMFNRKVSSMYKTLAQHIMGGRLGKRFVIVDSIVNDTSCSFDFIVPVHQADSLYPMMLNMLNQMTGYNGQATTRKQTCLVLKAKGAEGRFKSDSDDRYRQLHGDTYVLRKFPIRHLVSRLNSADISGDKIVLNETGYDGDIDITLYAPFDDLAHIRNQLAKYGLTLDEGEREVELFEITKD